MVRAAYSSGTPAIGVGPGNGPAYIERTADIPLAIKRIIDSKTFDNGTICASEQSVICDEDRKEEVQREMERQGAYFLTPEQNKKLGGFILRANGTNESSDSRTQRGRKSPGLAGNCDSNGNQGSGGGGGRCGT
mgnify:CR=1 FL=1